VMSRRRVAPQTLPVGLIFLLMVSEHILLHKKTSKRGFSSTSIYLHVLNFEWFSTSNTVYVVVSLNDTLDTSLQVTTADAPAPDQSGEILHSYHLHSILFFVGCSNCNSFWHKIHGHHSITWMSHSEVSQQTKFYSAGVTSFVKLYVIG